MPVPDPRSAGAIGHYGPLLVSLGLLAAAAYAAVLLAGFGGLPSAGAAAGPVSMKAQETPPTGATIAPLPAASAAAVGGP